MLSEEEDLGYASEGFGGPCENDEIWKQQALVRGWKFDSLELGENVVGKIGVLGVVWPRNVHLLVVQTFHQEGVLKEPFGFLLGEAVLKGLIL